MKQYIPIIREIVRELTEEYGRLNLFALFEREDLKSKWDVLISIKLPPERKNQLIKITIDKFKLRLSPEALINISRFVYLKPNHPFVIGINSAVEIDDSDVEIKNSQFNNVRIGHAIVISSTRS